MQEDMNDVQLMIAIKIYTKKLYQNVIMYVIFVSKIVLTHKFFVVYISTYTIITFYLLQKKLTATRIWLENVPLKENVWDCWKINKVIESSNRIFVKCICYMNQWPSKINKLLFYCFLKWQVTGNNNITFDGWRITCILG